jgi:hypothetical protein
MPPGTARVMAAWIGDSVHQPTHMPRMTPEQLIELGSGPVPSVEVSQVPAHSHQLSAEEFKSLQARLDVVKGPIAHLLPSPTEELPSFASLRQR